MPVESVIQNCSSKFKRELQKCFNKFAANNLKPTIGAILLYSADCRVTHYSVSVFFYQLAFYLHKIFLFIYTYLLSIFIIICIIICIVISDIWMDMETHSYTLRK